MTTFSSFQQNDSLGATPPPQSQNIFQQAGNAVENAGKEALDTLSTAGVRFGQLVGQPIAKALGATPQQIAYGNSQPTTLPLTGTVLPAQKAFGQGGAEQIGGQAATDAAYLIPGGEAEGIASKGIIGGALRGAGVGAVSGALGGAGNAMSQGQGVGQVGTSALQGAGTGALVGGALGGATGAVSNIWDKVYGTPSSSYDTNLANVTAANNQAGTAATNSIHEASNTVSDVNTGLGNQFAQAPEIIAKTDPTAHVTLPPDFVDKLNALKDTKAFSLPDYIREPSTPTDIKNIGSGERILNPMQAQDLATQLNDLKFNSKGDVVVNQQTSNLVSELKNLNQNGLGHVTDAQGNSVWNQAYQDYQQGKDAMASMSNLIPTKKVPGEMLDPVEVNNSVNKMMKMMETPQGTQALIRANTDFKSATGYDLLNDPMGTISKLVDSNTDMAKALKGNYGHQFIQGIKNPRLLSRRTVGIISTILGITALSTAFRKQIGNVISGQ